MDCNRNGNVAARRLLFGYLNAARTVDLSGGGRAAELYEQHIIDLVLLALGAAGEAGELAQERGLRAARRAAVLRAIDSRSGDPGLNAVKVAAMLGVTPRYVHLLLEETGRSFNQHLSEKRLQRSAALLRDPAWRHRKIADIALQAGFTDLSNFGRAFRHRFGATPSEVRAAAG